MICFVFRSALISASRILARRATQTDFAGTIKLNGSERIIHRKSSIPRIMLSRLRGTAQAKVRVRDLTYDVHEPYNHFDVYRSNGSHPIGHMDL